MTYAELWDDVLAFAAGLRRLGLGRGERVGVYLEKRIEAVVALFGSLGRRRRLRADQSRCCAPHQVGHILDDCGVRVLVTSPERLELLGDELRECQSVEHVVVVGGEAARTLGAGLPAVHGWDDSAAPTAPEPTGSTSTWRRSSTRRAAPGSRRASCSRTATCSSAARASASTSGNHERDRILAVLPLSFDAGFSQLTTAFAVGAQVVLVNYLLPGDVVRLCAKHGVTGLTCVPPLWNQLADQTWPDEATTAHALLRQHRRADAGRRRSAGCGRSSRGPSRT